jgi:hypothetical protein
MTKKLQHQDETTARTLCDEGDAPLWTENRLQAQYQRYNRRYWNGKLEPVEIVIGPLRPSSAGSSCSSNSKRRRRTPSRLRRPAPVKTKMIFATTTTRWSSTESMSSFFHFDAFCTVQSATDYQFHKEFS